MNTGISIWGLDFVPKLASVESDSKTQYLAITGYRGSTEEHIGIGEIQPTGTYKNSIQIWKLRLSPHEQVDPILDICLLHDYGVIFDLKWCPYGTYEEQDTTDGLAKLGILAFTCGDGTLRMVVVPHPDAVRRHITDDPQTVYSKAPRYSPFNNHFFLKKNLLQSKSNPQELRFLYLLITPCTFHGEDTRKSLQVVPQALSLYGI